jgi:hypothetical protein
MTTPSWLRATVHADFVAAVLLTVLAPLLLLFRALARRPAQLSVLLRYWRVSALLMVAVYLLAGRRPTAPAVGVLARLLIAQTLALPDLNADPLLARWAQITHVYCLLGAAANVPLLLPTTPALDLLRSAYAEPPTRYAALFHPQHSTATLAQIGDVGLAAYALGGLISIILRKIVIYDTVRG